MATAIHQYEDKLLDFAYGELPAPEASAVESHVKSCPRCTQALDQIRGVRTSMAALPQVAAPDAGLESLLAYAEQAAARHAAAPKPGLPWWRRIIAPLAGACALALVTVVAVKTEKEGGLDLSKEAAMAEQKAAKVEAPAPAPAPIVAAAPETQADRAELEQDFAATAEKMKAGKVRGGAEAERSAKEARAWDGAKKQNTLSKNDRQGYDQRLGETAAPAEEDRQVAQRKDLGDALKQSKTLREKSALDEDNFGNAGRMVKKMEAAEEAKKKPAPPADKVAEGDAKPPMGLSANTKSSNAPVAPPPPPPQAQPAPAPSTVAAAEPKAEPPAPKARQEGKPSIGLGLGSSSSSSSSYGGASTGSGGLGTRAPTRDNSDDELAGRGTSELADRKRLSNDAEAAQRDAEAEARPHLDAARAASNKSNHQEEVNQALYVLKTNVKGAYRAEALSRLCSALEELGNEGQADKYCDALLTEFPNSAAARVVANRRNQLQRGSAPPKAMSKKSPAYDEAQQKAEPAKPSKAKAADEAPAATSY